MSQLFNQPYRHDFDHGMFVRDKDLSERRGTILFLHGLGESGLCFEKLISHGGLFGWRLLVPDLPGYGRSPWLAEPLGLLDQADYLASWLKESESIRDCAPVVLIGHSMGGVTGLLFCERHPDLVAAFIDIDGNKSLEDCVFSGRAAAQDLDKFLYDGFDRLRDAVYQAGRRDQAQRSYYVSMRLADPRAYHRNSVELIEMSRTEDMARRMVDLPMPCHYIAGLPDGASPHSLELLTEAKAPWTGIESSGHWPFIDQTERFVVVVQQLLNVWFQDSGGLPG